MTDLISCPDCSKEISPRATSCPHCGAPNDSAPLTGNQQPAANTAMQCHNCKIALVRNTEKSSVSAAGLLGALLFIAGIPCLFLLPLLGIILMIIGILAGIMSKREHAYMVCPQCGYRREIP